MPNNYYRTDPKTGKSTDERLQSTNEYIHPSARTRIVLQGPGVDDLGDYDGHALTDRYKLKNNANSNGSSPFWEPRSRRERGVRNLPESPLWDIERQLIEQDPRMYDYLLGEAKEPRQR